MLSDTEKASHLGFLSVIDHPASGFQGGVLLVNSVGRPLEFHCTGAVKANRPQEILFGDSLKPYLFGEQIAQTLIQRVQGSPLCVFTDSIAVLAVQRFVELPILYVPPPIENILNDKQNIQENSHIEAENEQSHSLSDSEPLLESENATIPLDLTKNEIVPIAEQTEQAEQSQATDESLPKSDEPLNPDSPIVGFQPLTNIPGLNVDHWMKVEIAGYPLWFSDTHEEIVQAIREKLLDCSKSIDFAEPFLRIRLALNEAQKAA